MDTTWKGLIFQSIILDYFYTPNSWHALHFSERMYTIILPKLAAKGAIAIGGEVWLPHIPCIQERIQRLWTSLEPWFSKHEIADPTNNPLFEASRNVEAQILQSGDRFTNGSALVSLDKNFPFIMLRCICSGTDLNANQSAGCGNLVSEMMTNGIRQTRFKFTPSITTDKYKPSKGSITEPILIDDTHSFNTQRDKFRFLNADMLKQYPAPTGSPTGPPASNAHSLPSSILLAQSENLSTVPISIESDNTIVPKRTSKRISAQQQLTVDSDGRLGQWLANIRDPSRCPAVLHGGQHLKGAPPHAIDAFVDSLCDNLCARVLRLQNINFSNDQVRSLLEILPTTYVYALNIGELELDRETRQLLCNIIPRSHLVQIFLQELFDPSLRRHILHLLEINRPKVAALRSRLGEPPLPDHEALMWKRIKIDAQAPSLPQKRTAESIHADNPTENPNYSSSKKPRKTKTISTKAKKRKSSIPSTSPSLQSTTQRLLHSFFAPTPIPTLDPLQSSQDILEPTNQKCSNNDTTFTIPHSTPPSQRLSSQAKKHSNGSQATLPPIHTYFAPTIVPTTEPTQTIHEQSARPENNSTFQRRHRSKAAKRSHQTQITESSARDAGAGDGDGAGGGVAAAAFANSSCSSCVDVTCSCPDIICHDVSDMPACDVFDATIKSPEILSCPLALPGSTNNIGGSRRRRIVKHSTTRGASSLGSTSKLIQDTSVTVAPNTTPPQGSHSLAYVPSSSSMEFDKGIAFS